MQTKISTQEGVLVLAPSGKLDTLNAPEFLKQLQEALAQHPDVCLLDLSDVTFLSSSGLQALLGGAKISQKENIGFGVCCMAAMVADVFKMSGFARFIQSYDSREDALAQLKR